MQGELLLIGSGYLALTVAHWLVVAASLLVYVLSARMKQERRPPTAAVAWVLGLIALPYLVLPAYLLFGTRKLARVRKLPGTPALPHEHWAQRVLGSFGLAPAADVCTRL
ncbi:MAG TPA: PLDc N-terminal domain-containing protein, partial [Polyangiales bacterium]